MDARRNIILLTLDSLRADHLSSYGYDRETTTFLDSLVAEGVKFTSTFSASSHTREAVPAILTGQYSDSAVDTNFRCNAETIAEYLSRTGFATAAFHSNPFISRAYGFDRGFDTFDDDLHLGRHRLIALLQRAIDKIRNRHYASAVAINERSIGWIDSLDDDRPFFLWNHYMDPHGPYEPPPEYQRELLGEVVSKRRARTLYHRAVHDADSITGSERQLLVDLYDAEIAYSDDQLEALFDALRRRGLLDESVVVITADHGEGFGEHGYYEHPRYLHTELVSVPLILVSPDVDSSTIDVPTSTIDIAATIASTFVQNAPELPGIDLVDVLETPADYADRSVMSQVRGEGEDAHLWRFSARTTGTTVFAKYDTKIDELTLERQSFTGESVASDLRHHVAERFGGLQANARDDGETLGDVDDEISDRLSALGYK